MSEADSTAFELQINTDSELKQEVEEYRVTLKGIEFWGNEQIKEIVGASEKQLESEGFFTTGSKLIKSKPNFRIPYNLNIWVRYAVAASIAILAISLYFLFRTPVANETEMAFKQYYTPESQKINELISNLSPSGLAPADSLDSDTLVRGLKLYQEKKCLECSNLLANYKAADEVDDYRKFYLALALIEQNKFDEASSFLIPLADSDKFKMHEDAIWYLGLCYLSIKDGKANAINLFSQLAENPQSAYNSQANAILNQLK